MDYPVKTLAGGHTTADVAESIAYDIANEARRGGAYQNRDYDYLKKQVRQEARSFASSYDWSEAEKRAFVEDSLRELERQADMIGVRK
jgi:hypothetical protein